VAIKGAAAKYVWADVFVNPIRNPGGYALDTKQAEKISQIPVNAQINQTSPEAGKVGGADHNQLPKSQTQ